LSERDEEAIGFTTEAVAANPEFPENYAVLAAAHGHLGGYRKGGEDTPRGRSTKAIRNAIDRAGCNAAHLVERCARANCHTFRNTFASWLVQHGVSLFKVQALLGHADPRMTQRYAKLVPGAVSDEAAAVLDKLAMETAA